ncbi:MAG: hypothetical protein U1E39_17270 [Planctomycetota bacterium]
MRKARRWLAGIAVLLSGAWGPVADEVRAADAPAPAAPPAPPAAPVAEPARCVVTGRVVDGWGSGVADGRVAWVGDAPAGDDSTAPETRTDAEGRFRVEVRGPAGRRVRGVLVARRGEDAAEVRAVSVADRADSDVGELTLQAAQPLSVEVLAAGRPSVGARVWLWASIWGARGDGAVFLATATTGADGRVVLATFPRLHGVAVAHAHDGTVGDTGWTLDPDSDANGTRIETHPSRSVTVRVTDGTAAHAPVEGAQVFVGLRYGLGCVVRETDVRFGPAPLRTGPDGTVRVDGLARDERVTLVARRAGRSRGWVWCEAGATEATVELPRPLAIPIVDGEEPRPADGTGVVVRWVDEDVGQVEGRIDQGRLVVPVAPDAHRWGLAWTPDGSVAVLDSEKPTSFAVPRTVVVRVVEADGRVVPGVGVTLTSPGAGRSDPPVVTDAKGRAEFDGLAPGRHGIGVFAGRILGSGVDAGEVDLGEGDVTQDVVVGPAVDVVARLSVDGRPELPERLGWSLSNGGVVDATTDRAEATLRVRTRALVGSKKPAVLKFWAPGLRDSDPVVVPWPASGGAATIDVPLARVPDVVLEVRADPGARATAFLETWWPEHRDAPWVLYNDGSTTFTGRTRVTLERGRYRLRHGETGLVSAPFDVPERGGKVHATLDVTGLVTVRGRIEVPPGTAPRDFGIVAVGEGIDTRWCGWMTFGGRRGLPCDGATFEVRVPPGRPVRLSPSHEDLQPARDGGEVTVVGARDDVVLRLDAGASVAVTLIDVDGQPLAPRAVSGLAIAATRPPPANAGYPVICALVAVPGRPGVFQASGLPWGDLDLWVATGRYPGDGRATLPLGRVVLSAPVTDLGERRLTSGSKVVIHERWSEGPLDDDVSSRTDAGIGIAQFGPRQQVFATEVTDSPAVGSYLHLGAGRWLLPVRGTRSTPAGDVRFERIYEVDVDGVHDVALEVDLRVPTPPR